jgi:hypothetical protein
MLGAMALPAITLGALAQIGALNPQDESMLVMHIALMQVNLLAFGAAIYSAQGRVAHLYAYPVRTSTLVAWRLLPAMGIMAIEVAASTAVFNVVFNLSWPIWGPALFLAVAFAAFEAGLWLTDKSGWVVAALSFVGVAFGLWFKSRYGPMFDEPTRQWLDVTPAEMLSMFGAALLAYWVAVVAVARNRRGAPPVSLGIVAWIDRVLDRPPVGGRPFRSPGHAQFWFEWRRKGWIMPAAAVFGLVVGLVIWFFASRDSKELIDAFVAGGGLLSLVGFIGGLCMGNVGPSDGNFAMGHFAATRPMTTADMARILLQAAASSVLLAWLIWATVFLLAYGILTASGAVPAAGLLAGFGWWYFPVTLLGAWTVMACFTSIGLTGRSRLFFQLLCGIAVAHIGITMFAKFVLPPELLPQFAGALTAGVGAALVLGTAWAFAAARRRLLVEWPTVYGAAGTWVVGTAVVVRQLAVHGLGPWQAHVLLAGLLALAVAPLAAAPLALAWNRHR